MWDFIFVIIMASIILAIPIAIVMILSSFVGLTNALLICLVLSVLFGR